MTAAVHTAQPGSAPGPCSTVPVRPEPGLQPLDARAAGLMVLLCALWGLQQVSLKAVAAQASPMWMIGVRSAGAALLLGALMAWRGERVPRHRWALGAAAGSLFALEYLLVAQALQWTQASHVVVFLYTSPLFTALGLHLWRPQERLGRGGWVGLGLAFAGLALAFLGGGSAAAGPQALWGDALAVLAGLAMGATTVTLRCTRLADAPATETLLYQLLAAAALLLPAAGLSGGWLEGPKAPDGLASLAWPSAAVWAHLAFQTLVVSFASFLVWFWLLTRHSASRLGVFGFLTPLFGVGFGVVLLGDRLTPAFVAGGLLVLAGIAQVNRPVS
ncbi:DMT family transporter [Roseateles sp. BYS87W]|uniref:DMT family transporter n=1 Tax=Pelomonas baiyunensis TaxID=3299026 RepID=A0ABW7H3R2_9BURK